MAPLIETPDSKLITFDRYGWASGPFIDVSPGPAAKVYKATNTGRGFAMHSVVGEEADFQDGIPNRFLSMETVMVNGVLRFTDDAAASCQAILRKFATRRPGIATVIQMYPLTAATWTSGGPEANTSFLSMEMEGGGLANTREPMNALQIRAFVAWILACERWQAQYGNGPVTYEPGVNLLQHKEIAARWDYAATACASDRYDLGIAALQEVRAMPGNEERDIAQDIRLKALEETMDVQNDLMVIKRDLERTINGRHPNIWRIHQALRKQGLLIDPEHDGDYHRYAST